jgi:hypothetical protein
MILVFDMVSLPVGVDRRSQFQNSGFLILFPPQASMMRNFTAVAGSPCGHPGRKVQRTVTDW